MHDKLIDILKNILGVEELSADDDLLELGIDSIGIEELLYEIENNFGVILHIEDILETTQIAQLVELVSTSK